MSLQTRLAALITAVGADIKSLTNKQAETFLTYTVPGSQVVHTGTLQIPIVGGTYAIQGVTARLTTAPTGATTFKVDVNKNATTIFTTQGNRPIFTAGTNKADSAAPDVSSITTGDHLTVDVDAVGSTIVGSDLVVVIRLVRTGS